MVPEPVKPYLQGFDSIYLQAKKYRDSSVGRPEIQKFIGALAGKDAQKGIFITTSRFTKEAEEFANKNLSYKIVLIDGRRLSELMIEYELGVSTEYVYNVKKLIWIIFQKIRELEENSKNQYLLFTK